MKDSDKTKEQLLDELVKMRQRIGEFEMVEAERTRLEEELRNSGERLLRTLKGTIQIITSIVEMVDPSLAEHQERATNLACNIADEMGLSEKLFSGILMASLVHDIGKIHKPFDHLMKLSEPNDSGMSTIKDHPEIGYNILKVIEFPWPVAEIVLQHHERIDGSGYPKGLSGDDILMEARILGVADVVEGIALEGPFYYQGIKDALEEISKKQGVLYEFEVVDACLKLFAQKGFTFQ